MSSRQSRSPSLLCRLTKTGPLQIRFTISGEPGSLVGANLDPTLDDNFLIASLKRSHRKGLKCEVGLGQKHPKVMVDNDEVRKASLDFQFDLIREGGFKNENLVGDAICMGEQHVSVLDHSKVLGKCILKTKMADQPSKDRKLA